MYGDQTYKAEPSGVAGTESFFVILYNNQTPSDGVWTLIEFDTEIFDVGGNFTVGTDWKYTAPSAGKYQFNITVAAATDGSYGLKSSFVQLWKNGSLITGESAIFGLPSFSGSGNSGWDTGSIGWTILIDLDASDYLQIYGRLYRNSAATTQLFYSDASRRSAFSGFRVA